MWDRLKLFLNPIDGRYEDLKKGTVWKNVCRDFTAGLIVAMVLTPYEPWYVPASTLSSQAKD